MDSPPSGRMARRDFLSSSAQAGDLLIDKDSPPSGRMTVVCFSIHILSFPALGGESLDSPFGENDACMQVIDKNPLTIIEQMY